jgi:membrane-bound metal-dependent hydrolase YbcI (DUF457 family)
MFMAHFGVGLGAKAAAPKVSLGTLFLAAQFVDLIWPTLLLLGVERVNIIADGTRHPPLDFAYYPFSHSLLASIGWAALFAAIYFVVRRSRAGAVVLGLAVVSHWLLDLVVHYPDLPLYPGSGPLLGFGVWSSPVASMALELSIFGAGMWLYLRHTRASDGTGNAVAHPVRQRLRSPAPKRRGHRLGRPGTVADRVMGILGGQPPSRGNELVPARRRLTLPHGHSLMKCSR